MSLLVALAVAAAAFVKGAIGFGFPTLGTPLLTLLVDVKMAFLILIVPNIAMDLVQFARAGARAATVRRMMPVVLFGAVGIVMGTHLLALFAARTVMLILGGFILLFVVLSLTRACTSTRSACPRLSSSAPSASPSSSTRWSSWAR